MAGTAKVTFSEVVMIILGVAGVCFLIILYMYIRTQSLRRDLDGYRRQISALTGEVKHVEEITEALAFEQQIQLRKSITRAKQFGHPENELLKYTEIMTDALVKVTSESAKGHKNTSEAFKKYLSQSTDVSFTQFNEFMSSQSEKIKSEWHKKSVVDYFTVCQLLVDTLNGASTDNDTV